MCEKKKIREAIDNLQAIKELLVEIDKTTKAIWQDGQISI